MTGQLNRVHALLVAGNVPCEMKRRPDGSPVLVAGTPTSDQWDVLIWQEDGRLWVQHKGAIDRLTTGGSDQAVADAVKFRVVQSWADQGDPQAKALLSAIGDRYRESAPAAGSRESASPGYVGASRPAGHVRPAMRSVTAQISPWGFALRVTDRSAGDSIPTSWAWQWGLGTGVVTDIYQRFFTEFRNSLMGVRNEENL
jgi:hypothetical protein